MTKEELMRKTKEELVEMLIDFMKTNDKLLEQNQVLIKENEMASLNDYIYQGYFDYKKMYEEECRYNSFNQKTIVELQELLERYKNIVDKLGGSND